MRRILRALLVLVVVEGGALVLAVLGAGAHEEEERKISPTRDLILPAPWAGEWRITTTYRRGDTNTVTAVDDVTDVIRAGEPLGASALTRGGLATCTGAVTNRRLEVSCSRRFTEGLCHLAGAVGIVVDRDGETLVGFGEATGSATGVCGGAPPGSTRTTFELLGFRLSHDQGDSGEVVPPLLTRFVASSPLLLIAVASRQVRPVIEDDRKHGAWRTFETLAFKNQGQCIKFVHEQERPDDRRHSPHGREGER